jgi:hypothetical protein
VLASRIEGGGKNNKNMEPTWSDQRAFLMKQFGEFLNTNDAYPTTTDVIGMEQKDPEFKKVMHQRPAGKKFRAKIDKSIANKEAIKVLASQIANKEGLGIADSFEKAARQYYKM